MKLFSLRDALIVLILLMCTSSIGLFLVSFVRAPRPDIIEDIEPKVLDTILPDGEKLKCIAYRDMCVVTDYNKEGKENAENLCKLLGYSIHSYGRTMNVTSSTPVVYDLRTQEFVKGQNGQEVFEALSCI